MPTIGRVTESNGGWPPPIPPSGGTTTDQGDRDGTPPTIERLSRAAVRKRSKSGPSATAIAGVLLPILLILVGTVLIAIALDPGESPQAPEQPEAALGEDEPPVNETPPVSYTLTPVDTTVAATAAPTVPATEPPTTVPAVPATAPPATTGAGTDTTTPGTPSTEELQQAALASAQAYLAAIAAGDLATAQSFGSDAQSVDELQAGLPGITAGRLELVQFGPPVGAVVPMRLLLITQHELEGVVDTALTCAHWDGTRSAVVEVAQQEVARVPGATVTDDQVAQAFAECAVMEL